MVASDPAAGLAYGRLSVDRDHLLTEAGLHVFERVQPQPAALAPMSDESFVRLKRRVFRASERSEAGKRRRWLLERDLSPALEKGTVTRNTVMHPDIHVLWPEDLSRRDILHEYFVPRAAVAPFIAGLRAAVKRRKANLLNVTIRDVRKDTDTLLAYAREDSFAFVLFLSQEPTPEGEEAMRVLTGELIDLARSLGGSFYLPYRLHSSLEQVRASYPGLDEFLALKKSHDREGMFSSRFFRHIFP